MSLNNGHPVMFRAISGPVLGRDDVRLLFTDIQMPGSCDGMELTRQVHARWPSILLVITSGQIKPTQAEIPDHGHFIGKPYRANELLDEVNDMMGKA
jgi:two-component system, response regulator PdtaR